MLPCSFPSRQSPSVYVVFPTIQARNGCTQVGALFTSITTSFAPGELSTVRSYSLGVDGSHYPEISFFDFRDIPCPPPGVLWNRTEGTYKPLLAPPDFLFDLDPAFRTCIPASGQGVDPPIKLQIAQSGSGPGPVGGGPPHNHPKRRLAEIETLATAAMGLGPQPAGAVLPSKRYRKAMEQAHPVPWAPQRTASPAPKLNP